jgi:rRNA processing protein Krr1/Pno1
MKYNEYLVEKVIVAMEMGFDAEDAVLLKNENFSLEILNVKDYTHRKNLEEYPIQNNWYGRKGKKNYRNFNWISNYNSWK